MRLLNWILYLDFDGVLNNDQFLRHQRNHLKLSEHALFDPQNVRCLENLCKLLPVSQIIITSTWRSQRSIHELRQLMVNEGVTCADLVMDKTNDGDTREEEILSHVQQHGFEHWIALDDMVLADLPGNHFYRVRPSTGLTMQDINSIKQQLDIE